MQNFGKTGCLASLALSACTRTRVKPTCSIRRPQITRICTDYYKRGALVRKATKTADVFVAFSFPLYSTFIVLCAFPSVYAAQKKPNSPFVPHTFLPEKTHFL